MKRNFVLFLILGFANLGCMDAKEFSFSWMEKSAPPAMAPESPTVTRKEKPITADQITEQNARDKAKSLTLELDRDEQGGLRIDTEVEVPGNK
jgi:hypothetical protein